MAEPFTDVPLTMAQIASLAGVSVPTVSKVINQRADVAPATRARVEQIIATHGYVVNQTARSLRKGSSGYIDFIVGPEFQSSYAFEILRGAEEALLSTSRRLVLASTQVSPSREQQWRQRLVDGAVDGAIIVLARSQSLYVQELQRRNIPFVAVDPLGQLGPDVLAVSATNWAGGKRATQYLLSLGHRRIAALMGDPTLPSTQDRLQGYRAALQEAGVPCDEALVRYGDFHAERACQEMGFLFALPDPPTAVFVGNDEQCLGVYRAVQERGLSIPDDLSVVGFDNIPYTAWITPALTTIHQPLLEMGRTATNVLLRVLAGEAVETVRIELATPLVQRASCAPPRHT